MRASVSTAWPRHPRRVSPPPPFSMQRNGECCSNLSPYRGRADTCHVHKSRRAKEFTPLGPLWVDHHGSSRIRRSTDTLRTRHAHLGRAGRQRIERQAVRGPGCHSQREVDARLDWLRHCLPGCHRFVRPEAGRRPVAVAEGDHERRPAGPHILDGDACAACVANTRLDVPTGVIRCACGRRRHQVMNLECRLGNRHAHRVADEARGRQRDDRRARRILQSLHLEGN